MVVRDDHLLDGEVLVRDILRHRTTLTTTVRKLLLGIDNGARSQSPRHAMCFMRTPRCVSRHAPRGILSCDYGRDRVITDRLWTRTCGVKYRAFVTIVSSAVHTRASSSAAVVSIAVHTRAFSSFTVHARSHPNAQRGAPSRDSQVYARMSSAYSCRVHRM